MNIYDIAGIRLEVRSDLDYVNKVLKEFLSAGYGGPCLIIKVTGSDLIRKPDGIFAESRGCSWAHSMELPGVISSTRQLNSGEIICRMDIESTWSYCKISYNVNHTDDFISLTGQLLESLFRYKLIFHRGLVIHAAGLNWRDKGILLSAPSGIGKSTQADLWKRFKHARVLNGDHTAVRIIDNTPVVFGSPWSGSSPDFYNGKVDLSTIIILQQAGENSIRRLSRSEAAAMLLPRCFLPSFSEEMMDMAVDTFDTLINKVPIYLLACRPDKEAVDLVCSFADELNAND